MMIQSKLFGSTRAVHSGRLLLVAALLGAGTAQAELTVSKIADLSFGTFVQDASGGTVTISASGTRSASGGIVLFTQGAGAGGQRAQFNVSGGPVDTACTITLPEDEAVSLSALSGPGVAMTVSDIASSPSTTITLDGNGAGTIYVGGILNVAASQAAGSYSAGNLTITITC